MAGWVCCGAGCSGILVKPAGEPVSGEKVPAVRVQIGSGPGPFRLAAGRGIIFSGREQPVRQPVVTVYADRGRVTVADTLGMVLARLPPPVMATPRGRQLIQVEQRAYRGVLRLGCRDDTLVIINVLDVESYLKGVLPLEMGERETAELEALKAQAVAARTYALYQLHHSGAPALAADELDQMYGGSGVEYKLAGRAVDQTRGEVLVCADSLIKANYFSTCGGKTETPELVWPERSRGCFVSVEDTFCSVSRHYRWREVWPADQLEQLINKYMPGTGTDLADTLGRLQDIRVINRLPSGRVDTLEVVTDRGVYRLSRDPLRWVLRRPLPQEPILRSTFFDVQVFRTETGVIDTIVVQGKGNGHGVGMCQWGAIGRSRAGHSYAAILKHFYPGAEQKRVY